MNIDLFDYGFDGRLIAKYPAPNRGDARLLAVDVKNFKMEHKKFFEITEYINKNDVVAVNDSYVKKARIFGKRASGGRVEIFITEFPSGISFPLKLNTLLKSHKTIKEGEEIIVTEKTESHSLNSAIITALKNLGDGNYEILIKNKKDYDYIFDKCAQIPLPPYLKREPDKSDDGYYQTVYAKYSSGLSVAAPTAGLHFTDETINGIKAKGGVFTAISLNIGLGTFLPVRTADIRKHKIHKETYSISEETADIINKASESKNKIILTGTSAVRCVESSIGAGNKVVHGSNLETSLYIYPGYKFKITRNLITNFHQPKSSLYIMICALIGIDKTKAVYEEAVRNNYSLFSYGDAMYLYNI
ncbi:MAG: tRNA preQ1(34) S-adenosylmethionine ribosyltransferase-isomerase QueA [bacterium]